MIRGKKFVAALAALSLAAAPAFAQSGASQSVVDARASTEVSDAEEGFGGKGLLYALFAVAAVVAAIVILDGPDSP